MPAVMEERTNAILIAAAAIVAPRLQKLGKPTLVNQLIDAEKSSKPSLPFVLISGLPAIGYPVLEIFVCIFHYHTVPLRTGVTRTS
jgi:hypothetical protein